MGIIQRIREKRLQRDLNRCVNIFRKMNSNMKKMGWARQRRRQFWREFSKSRSLQEEIFGALANSKK